MKYIEGRHDEPGRIEADRTKSEHELSKHGESHEGFRLGKHLAESHVQFGDHVRIREDQSTVERGLAGEAGTVYGQTTPSVTAPDVVGTPQIDYAINVHVTRTNEQYWIAPHLVELIDHGAGTTITLGKKQYIRQSDGTWLELRD